MSGLRPSLKLLRVLAGEGDFHIYRLLRSRRSFLFAKCMLTTYEYYTGRGNETSDRAIAFIKGANQFRYFRHAQLQLETELGDLQPYVSSPLSAQSSAKLLPRISSIAFLQQASFLLMMLMTGSRRYLNLYLLAFSSSMRMAVKVGFRNVELFVCFNDQPYDVAAIINALHERKGCRTIVIQHGLILSHKFYFPSVAKQFWAWGEMSRKHYHAWDNDASLIVKGRYSDDSKNKAIDFLCPKLDRPFFILVAPSFFHHEVRDILLKVASKIASINNRKIHIAIKFHPATKVKWTLRRWIKNNIPIVKEEVEPMEVLSLKYDALITKNSTSAIDFLLLGKLVFFTEFSANGFPSADYGFSIDDIGEFGSDESLLCVGKNCSRNNFLKAAINV